jgi:hypothetical protein
MLTFQKKIIVPKVTVRPPSVRWASRSVDKGGDPFCDHTHSLSQFLSVLGKATGVSLRAISRLVIGTSRATHRIHRPTHSKMVEIWCMICSMVALVFLKYNVCLCGVYVCIYGYICIYILAYTSIIDGNFLCLGGNKTNPIYLYFF